MMARPGSEAMGLWTLRVVPRGMPAVGCGDDYDDVCEDDPHDLVLLEETDAGEVETGREEHVSGHAACVALRMAVRRE